MHNELIKLVESTNQELQEKELKLIKEEGLKQLDKLEESVNKMEEAGFGRGVIGRQMAALPTSDESELFRLGKRLKMLDPVADKEEMDSIKAKMEELNSRIDDAGRGGLGSGSSILGPKSADNISLGVGRAPFVGAGQQRRAASASIARKVDRPLSAQLGTKPEGIKDQIGMLRNKMMTVKSREEADEIMNQIKYLQSLVNDQK